MGITIFCGAIERIRIVNLYQRMLVSFQLLFSESDLSTRHFYVSATTINKTAYEWIGKNHELYARRYDFGISIPYFDGFKYAENGTDQIRVHYVPQSGANPPHISLTSLALGPGHFLCYFPTPGTDSILCSIVWNLRHWFILYFVVQIFIDHVEKLESEKMRS